MQPTVSSPVIRWPQLSGRRAGSATTFLLELNPGVTVVCVDEPTATFYRERINALGLDLKVEVIPATRTSALLNERAPARWLSPEWQEAFYLSMLEQATETLGFYKRRLHQPDSGSSFVFTVTVGSDGVQANLPELCKGNRTKEEAA